MAIKHGIVIYDDSPFPLYICEQWDEKANEWYVEKEKQFEEFLRQRIRERNMTEEEFADIFIKTKKQASEMTLEERCERLTMLQDAIKALRTTEQATYQAESESLENLTEEEKEKHIAAVKSFTEKASSPKAKAERKKKDASEKLVELFMSMHNVSKEEAVKMVAKMGAA